MSKFHIADLLCYFLLILLAVIYTVQSLLKAFWFMRV